MNLWARREGARILLVDDDERIRDSMKLFFEDHGSVFTAVGSSELALEELQRHSFDVIFVDYKLPGMNGLDLLKRIRQTHPESAKILVTAYSSEALSIQAQDEGAVAFIRKPLSAEKIEACLTRIDRRDGVSGCRKEYETG